MWPWSRDRGRTTDAAPAAAAAIPCRCIDRPAMCLASTGGSVGLSHGVGHLSCLCIRDRHRTAGGQWHMLAGLVHCSLLNNFCPIIVGTRVSCQIPQTDLEWGTIPLLLTGDNQPTTHVRSVSRHGCIKQGGMSGTGSLANRTRVSMAGDYYDLAGPTISSAAWTPGDDR